MHTRIIFCYFLIINFKYVSQRVVRFPQCHCGVLSDSHPGSRGSECTHRKAGGSISPRTVPLAVMTGIRPNYAGARHLVRCIWADVIWGSVFRQKSFGRHFGRRHLGHRVWAKLFFLLFFNR